MGNWSSVLQEINDQLAQGDKAALDTIRRKYLHQLSEYSSRNVIAYYSGFLTKPQIAGIEIEDNDKNGFMLAIHELDRSKGLDLIIHSPGGGIAATESLAHYLKEMFGNDIRAIVPQIAMSAGTMLACCCKSILMGKHSNIGPIDPQMFGMPAIGVTREFKKAREQIIEDPRVAEVWRPIFSRISPAFLEQCELAEEWSKDFVTKSLMSNMFVEDSQRVEKATKIVDGLLDFEKNKAHNKHLHHEACKELGIVTEMLEDDQKLQNLVLTVHHCFMHTFGLTNAIKIIENNLGRAQVRTYQPQSQGVTIGFGNFQQAH